MRSSRSGRPDPFTLVALPVAHRGLHGGGRVENSRAAFRAAIELGQGIELDVQASGDGEAMVFHDDRLDRLTSRKGPIRALSATELGSILLRGSKEGIPTLSEILDLVAGRVPLLIEVKAPGRRVAESCSPVFRALRDYPGVHGVMSFNPEVPRWFRVHAPCVLRGLVVSEKGKSGPRGRLERRFSALRARPDFLAYDVRDLPSRFAAAHRARGLPVLTWTVRSPADLARAAFADQMIHELPAE